MPDTEGRDDIIARLVARRKRESEDAAAAQAEVERLHQEAALRRRAAQKAWDKVEKRIHGLVAAANNALRDAGVALSYGKSDAALGDKVIASYRIWFSSRSTGMNRRMLAHFQADLDDITTVRIMEQDAEKALKEVSYPTSEMTDADVDQALTDLLRFGERP